MNEFHPVLSLAPDSFRLLCESFLDMDILIGKTGEGIMTFCALRCPQPESMFTAAKIEVGPPVNLVLVQGVDLERSAQRLRMTDAYSDDNGKRILRFMNAPPRFTHLCPALQQGDYVRLSLTPANKPLYANMAYSSAVNKVFQSASCYAFAMSASRPSIADALTADLRTSGGEFVCTQEARGPNVCFRVGPHVLTNAEAAFMLDGMGALCSEMLPQTLLGSMNPAQAVNLPKPDIVIGKHCGFPVGLRLGDLLTNLAVIGLSGSGKSTLLKRIAAALHNQGIPVIIVAPIKYDFSEAFPGCDLFRAGDDDHPLRLNILDMPHTSEAVSIAAGALSHVIPAPVEWLEMFYANTLTGLLAASDGKPVGLSDLARTCKADFDSSGYTKNRESPSMKEAMLNRLKSVYLKPEFNTSVSNLSFDRMMEPGRITVIELHSMEASNRRVFGAVFLQRLMHAYRSRFEASVAMNHLAIILDELHELLAADKGADKDAFRDSLNSSLSTARGMGISHIMADQRYDLMAEIATHGCSNHIFLNQPRSEQIANLLSLPAESDCMERMPFFGFGEGLIHVARSRTILFDARFTEEEPLLPMPAGASEKAFLPYPAICSRVCKSCCFTLHKAVFDSVAGQLSGACGAYGDYVRAVRAANALDDPGARSNAIYLAKSKLLGTCVNAAVKKVEAAGMNAQEKLPILQYCVRHELQRQLSFRI